MNDSTLSVKLSDIAKRNAVRCDCGKRLYYSAKAGTSDYPFRSESIIAEQYRRNDGRRCG